MGSSFSAEDIAMHCQAAGAKYVTISYRSQAQPLAYPEGIDVRPILQLIDGNTIRLKQRPPLKPTTQGRIYDFLEEGRIYDFLEKGADFLKVFKIFADPFLDRRN